MGTGQPWSAETMPVHDSTITGRTQITRLLSHLQDLHCPVSIEIADLPRQQRHILAINPDAEYLMVDVKVPSGRPFPTRGQNVNLSAEFHGEQAICSTRILECADMAGKALLRIHLPETINYRQRRAFFRVVLDTDPSIHVTLIDEMDGSRFGVLEDISLGGLAVCIPTEPDPTSLQAELCLIQLPGGEIFHSELKVTNTRITDADVLRVGGRFHRTRDAQLRKLERFIRQIEREQIKKRTD